METIAPPPPPGLGKDEILTLCYYFHDKLFNFHSIRRAFTKKQKKVTPQYSWKMVAIIGPGLLQKKIWNFHLFRKNTIISQSNLPRTDKNIYLLKLLFLHFRNHHRKDILITFVNLPLILAIQANVFYEQNAKFVRYWGV